LWIIIGHADPTETAPQDGAASKGLVARVALVSPALTMANAKPDTSVAIVAAATAHVLIDLWNLKVF
jgi:hypothetical protein